MAEDQKPLTPCPECGAERIEADVKDSQAGGVSLRRHGKLFGSSSLKAVVCTGCGLTNFYANTPLKLVIKRPDKPLKDDQEDE